MHGGTRSELAAFESALREWQEAEEALAQAHKDMIEDLRELFDGVIEGEG